MIGGGVACGGALGHLREKVPKRAEVLVFVLLWPYGRLMVPGGLWVSSLRSVLSAALVLVLAVESHGLLAGGAVSVPGRMGLVT